MAVVMISRFMAVRIPVVNALLSYEGLEVRARPRAPGTALPVMTGYTTALAACCRRSTACRACEERGDDGRGVPASISHGGLAGIIPDGG